MVSKICPIMSNMEHKVPCDINCAFCVRKNGITTCTVNLIAMNSEKIIKKLDSIISNQKNYR